MDNAYFVVQSWMVTQLGLKTVERDCYAIIYGYSMDGESNFHGSLSYLAEITGYSKNSICTALKNLTDKELIIKEEYEVNKIKHCRYKVNQGYTSSLYGIQDACMGGIQALCTNNKTINNNKNILSKDSISGTDTSFTFGKSNPQPKAKMTNKDEFDNACLAINTFTDDITLRQKLITLFSNRYTECGKNRQHFYASTHLHYLEELKQCRNVQEQIGAVDLSLRYNNTLKVMIPSNNSKPIHPDTNTYGQVKTESKPARNKDGSLMEF